MVSEEEGDEGAEGDVVKAGVAAKAGEKARARYAQLCFFNVRTVHTAISSCVTVTRIQGKPLNCARLSPIPVARCTTLSSLIRF